MPRSSIRRLTAAVVTALAVVAVVIAAVVLTLVDDASAGAGSVVPANAQLHQQQKPVYAALGSSFAAGPGEGDPVPGRCGQTSDNYPRRVAAELGMRLIDASCSGATAGDILHPSVKHPERGAQLAKVPADASLVTITVGGNDVGYISRTVTSACSNLAAGLYLPPVPAEQFCKAITVPSQFPDPGRFAQVQQTLVDVVHAVRARAPQARVVLVQYPPVVSVNEAPCAALPLEPWQVVSTAAVGEELRAATLRAGQAAGAQVVGFDQAAAHTVCSAQPWIRGFGKKTPYHPNKQGKSEMAAELVSALR